MLDSGSGEIAYKLDGMSDGKEFHGLKFDDQAAIDDEVRLERANLLSLIENWQRGVDIEGKTCSP